jgi:hypothetical protein
MNRNRNYNFSKVGTGTGTITFQKSELEPQKKATVPQRWSPSLPPLAGASVGERQREDLAITLYVPPKGEEP